MYIMDLSSFLPYTLPIPNGPTLVALAHAETTKTSCSGVATGHCNRNDPTAAGDKTKCRQRSKPAEEANGTGKSVNPGGSISWRLRLWLWLSSYSYS
jgi:hypothetical protein